MKARDVMVSPVITVDTAATLEDVVRLLLKHRISAVPVVDDRGRLVGMVSEGDLTHRCEIGTARQRSRLMMLLLGNRAQAEDYIKTHATKVADMMTRTVIAAEPETPLSEIATLMELHNIKRVPIVRDGQLVGIVSRANLVQAIATSGTKLEVPIADTTIRDKLLAHLKAQAWAHTDLLNATVRDGVVNLWGFSSSEVEKTAIRVAAEQTPGVRAVNNHITVERLAPPDDCFGDLS